MRTVSTLSPPTELLTLQRYFPESSTLASLMIRVPLTCLTRSSNLTGCLAVLPSTYLYHLRVKNRDTLTPHRKTYVSFYFPGFISPRKKRKESKFFSCFFRFLKSLTRRGRGNVVHPSWKILWEIPVDGDWESGRVASQISSELGGSCCD